MGVALSALRAWVGDYLPVVGEGLAGGEITHHASDEGEGEEDVKVTEHFLVGSLPDASGEGFEVDADAVFHHPETGF